MALSTGLILQQTRHSNWSGWGAVDMLHLMQTSTTRWLRVSVCLVLTIDVYGKCHLGELSSWPLLYYHLLSHFSSFVLSFVRVVSGKTKYETDQFQYVLLRLEGGFPGPCYHFLFCHILFCHPGPF